MRSAHSTSRFAPLAVALGKSVLTAAADAIDMPEVMGEIHPFLCAVAAHRAVKQLANAGEGLLLKCNEVVCGRGFLPGGQLELTVQGFQIVSNRVHRSIVPQFRPIVKRVFGDLHRIRLIGLDLAEGVVAVLLDEQRVDRRNIKPGFVENLGDALIVASGVLHNHPCFAFDDRMLYKRRNEVERFFRRIKRFRRVFTRYDKLDIVFAGFILFARIFDSLV